MPRLFALLAVPTALFLPSLLAHGHNCGHHGGCASSTSRDHGCYGCGSWNAGSRWNNSPPAAGQTPSRPGPANTQTHEVKIAEVVYLPGATPENAIVELRALDGSTPVLVRLGPAGFLKQNQLNLRDGDAVTVTGYRVAAGPEDLLIATEVSKQGKTVRFRDSRGRPAW